MTSLICLIQAANLKDGRRIGERERFETDAEEAEILVRGGIAKPAPVQAVKEPEPIKEAVPAKVVEEPAPEPAPENVTFKKRKR